MEWNSGLETERDSLQKKKNLRGTSLGWERCWWGSKGQERGLNVEEGWMDMINARCIHV
jgi:hypothetical protein